jgi:hypothetical protein
MKTELKKKKKKKKDTINVKVCVCPEKLISTSRRSRKLKFVRLLEGPPKAMVKI